VLAGRNRHDARALRPLAALDGPVIERVRAAPQKLLCAQGIERAGAVDLKIGSPTALRVLPLVHGRVALPDLDGSGEAWEAFEQLDRAVTSRRRCPESESVTRIGRLACFRPRSSQIGLKTYRNSWHPQNARSDLGHFCTPTRASRRVTGGAAIEWLVVVSVNPEQ